MINSYSEYLNLIKEGLIKTYNIEKYSGTLDIEFNAIGIKFELDIKSKFKFDLRILNPNKLNQNQLDMIITICNNLGYYPSFIYITNEKGKINSFIYDKNFLSNKYFYLKLTFEAKYEDGLYKNDLKIPEQAYHLTKQKYKEKILYNGLYPKSYNRKTKHPDRIYLFYDLNDYIDLLNGLKINDSFKLENNEYILLEVKLNDKMIIHTDPNYDKGFFTYDNITPKCIKVIKENL
jgi:hypothetical protein